MLNQNNSQCAQDMGQHMCWVEVFPGDGVFISDPNILIPFTSDYREDIDWLKGFHAVQVKIIIYLYISSYDFD